MTDLARNAPPMRFRYPELLKVERWTLDNSAAQTVFVGQPMIIDASADTVNLRGWVSTTTLVTATDIVIGIAREKKVVLTTDTEGDNEIEVIVGGEVGIKSAVFTDADVGKIITFSDSGVLSSSAEAATKLPIGRLTRVVDGYAFIELFGYPYILSF